MWSPIISLVYLYCSLFSWFGCGFKGRYGGYKISKATTSDRRQVGKARVASQRLSNTIPKEFIVGNIECDSHADTCVLGMNFIVLMYSGRECDVMAFTDSVGGVTNVPIVSGGTVWQCPETGECFLLIIHEALWMPDQMPDTLINPNQLRSEGVVCQDNAWVDRLYIKASTEDDSQEITIPMTLEGNNVTFRTRTPCEDEIHSLRRIHLTSQRPWDPRNLVVPEFSRVSAAGVAADPFDHVLEAPDADVVFDQHSFNARLVKSCRVLEVPDRTVVVSAVDAANSEVLEDRLAPIGFATETRRPDVTPEVLSDRWLISLKQAKKTLAKTTQLYRRSALMPLSRRYHADRMFHLPRLRGEWATDTVFGPCKSMEGNTCGQIFTNDSYFAKLYPMEREGQSGQALKTFCKEFGVPEFLRMDGGPTMLGKHKEFDQTVKREGIRAHPIEPGMKNQNPAEGVYREVKRKWYRVMVRKLIPRVFWDYGLTWCCEIMSRTFTRSHAIDGMVPLQGLTGDVVEISPFLEFSIWDRVWFRDNAGLGKPKLGRWLGVAENRGSLMTYHVLSQTGQVLPRSTVWHVTELEKETDEVKEIIRKFDAEIDRRCGTMDFPEKGEMAGPEVWGQLAEDPLFQEEFLKVYEDENLKDAFDDRPENKGKDPAEFSPGICDDTMLRMEIALPRGNDGPSLARVKRRKLDDGGLPVGTAHSNPILDTRLFEVEFLDGHVETLSANVIAEHLFAQVDHQGHRLMLMDEIIDVRKGPSAIPKEDGFITSKNGQQRRRQTTQGWSFLIKWKDGSETWVPLKDCKEAYPVQVAEYVIQSQLEEEPAFAWWVPHVIRKRAAILAKVKSKYWQTTHKYGIEMPKSAQHAQELDAKNGNTLWWDAIVDEMRTILAAPAVEKIEDGKIPVGYKHIDCHLIFDIKLGENYRRKARYVAGGHKTEVAPHLTYSSVVSRDSVRICLMIAALNGLDVQACDIKGAYLTAPAREKLVTTAGPEFGKELEGSLLKITRALYGQKSAGAAFRSYLAEHLWNMEFRPSQSDPDVWLRPAVKANGTEYYEYLLAYVDDLLAISMNAKAVLGQVAKKFKLKNDKIAPPEDYLGAVLSKMKVGHDDVECWSQSAEKYVKASVENVERRLSELGRTTGLGTKKQCYTPLLQGYKPELDTTPELKADGLQYYQELIGVLRWSTELGRLDILHEVGLMSQYLACPREGHLEAVLHIFGYLKHKEHRKIAFDPTHPPLQQARFKRYDWTDWYKGAKEDIPPKMPRPRGKPVSTSCFVDASFANNVVNRRSWMGILIFVNRAPVQWLSKRTNTVEASTFGAEIVALRHAVDMIMALRYKLRMFGVPLEGATNVFCDNEAVTKNVSDPTSTLSKKHHAINYHRCREAVAADIVRVAYESTKTNLSDTYTKILSGHERDKKLDKYMY